ncbi:coat protein [ssRNA phage Gerhypos.4_31]|uniref:Coat protein n=2 Tax=Leviviricetes TaxID=2842243 RepID=A0A8S5L3K4_9VIRU|nr:coat protein [ssRNA phage Gerhypos.4_31]QDH90121.1 MAG: hypothetical protein H4Bulk46589_000002 [Leviviridae sp.]DAD52083.1 TPA_asm: coat protein [ssRNA phage Gerhypos.4_31]
MLTDPQAVTISGTASSLPKLEQRADTSVYSNVADGVDLFVTQKVAKDGRRRTTASLQKSVIVTDPITGLKSRIPYSISTGTSYPVGIAATDVVALYTALNTALQASTNALLTKIINGER